MEALFGPQLLTKDGLQDTATALADATAIGIYFSAHWCPPCRGFTPVLGKMFTETLAPKGMKIVFASSDRDESAFDEYYAEMPWMAMPFSAREAKDKLSAKYKVRGIPSFVIIAPDGSLITLDGRKAVSSDPTAAKYPWTPPTKAEKAARTLELLKTLVDKTGAVYSDDKIAGKAVGLYFSAHWCPPCRGFTPQLAKWYDEGLKDKLEIVFISSDRDQDSFNEYLGEMPWLALPFDKRAEKSELSDMFGVEGIPSFAVINAAGEVITTDGRSAVSSDPTGANFPDGWLPQPMADLDDNPDKINEMTSIVAFSPDEAGKAALLAAAKDYQAKAGGEIDDMKYYFFSASGGNLTQRVQSMTKTADAPPGTLILMDLPAGGKYYNPTTRIECTAEGIKSLIEFYEAGALEAQQLS